jgi:hypothetical protein
LSDLIWEPDKVTAEARTVRLMKRDFDPDLNHAIRAPGVTDRVQIKKLDQEEQLVFGEVYAPGFPDSQGDFMTPEQIKKMAYNFMRKGAMSNIDTHHDQRPNGSYVVESFIARKDDPIFIPGSWVIGVKVPDSAVWRMVKSGELNGFSLDGLGVRTEKTFVVEMPELLKGETDDVRNHRHQFVVKFDKEGNFLGGYTNPGPNGHVHQIVRGTVTEMADHHTHRFSFVEGVLHAQADS